MKKLILIISILVIFSITSFHCAKRDEPEEEPATEQMEEAEPDSLAAPESEAMEGVGSGDDPIEITYPEKNDTTS